MKDIYLHIDNSRPHLIEQDLKEIWVTRLEHLSCSYNLAPCDFLHNGYLKVKHEGTTFHFAVEFFDHVSWILIEIPKFTFMKVFEEWKNGRKDYRYVLIGDKIMNIFKKALQNIILIKNFYIRKNYIFSIYLIIEVQTLKKKIIVLSLCYLS
jgi:hypothetical protein